MSHTVALSAALMGGGLIGMRARLDLKLRRRGFSSDRALRYKVYRSWDPLKSAQSVLQDFRPDVAVVLAHRTGPLACALKDLGVATVLSLQDAEYKNDVDCFAQLAGCPAVANSAFTARAYQRFGISARVIHPPIEREKYETRPNGNKILFVNPVEKKGLTLALEIARRLPKLRFEFLLTWPLSRDELAQLRVRLSDLRNVELTDAQDDMRPVYGRSRLLLAPSQWQEGYGRVVTEAQFSGIPVLASSRGGLPESVGPGGAILAHDEPADQWVEALLSMLEPARYDELSRLARKHAGRTELNIDYQASLWEQVIADAVRSRSSVF